MARGLSGDKRSRILEGALKVIAAKGFYNTKVAEVAKEAGVADGTIYNYFKNKDDLLISLFEDRMDWIIRRLDVELEGGILKRISRYIELHLYLAQIEPELAEFITVELRQSGKFIHEYENQRFTRYLRILANLVEEGQHEGVFRADMDPKLVSRAIFGALDELLISLTWSKRNRPVDVGEIERTVKTVSELFIAGLLRDKDSFDQPTVE